MSAMDSARWEQIQAILFGALDVPPGERGDFLDRECGADTALRDEVASLLRQHDEDPGWLESPVVHLEDPSAPAGEGPVRHVGPYRLVRPLGQGGMGDVYLAVQEGEDYSQSVAVKLIRRGLDTAEVLERFRLERRILATLQHPNIAQLLDGGATDDGRPFFVMEYIEGLPIDRYADRHRLSIRQRLDLILVIGAAVQHAHRNLVVHRDIKPGNILVTEAAVPKLLDFGIGKVLGSSEALGPSIETRTQLRVLTPEYAAPEQVRGEPVTTATDVYGLGVLLYELLTGHRPYSLGAGTPLEIERAVCATDPPQPSDVAEQPATRAGTDEDEETLSAAELSARRATEPSRLRRQLAGDLDNIILMALRKEPARRYASAAALCDDIRRHLDGLPVAARPDTFGYRAGKFVRRNAGAVAAAAAMLLALVGATAVTLVQSRRVARERDIAIEERAKAVEVRGFLLEMFGGTGADQAATDTLTARQLLDLQASRIDETYAERPTLRAEMMWVLADGYERLGLFPAADTLAQRALALRRELLGPTHPDVAASLNQVGWISHELGRSSEALPYLEDAVAIRRGLDDGQRLELSRSLNDHGAVLDHLGESERATVLFGEALAIRTAVHGESHRSVGITASNLAVAYFRLGRYAEAIELEETALRALRASVGPDHQRSIIAQSNLAIFQMRLGELESAERTLRDLLERQTRVQGADHPITAVVMGNLGTVLSNRGRLEEAEGFFRRSLVIREAKLGPRHSDVASSLSGLATALSRQGRLADALEANRRALAIYRGTFGEEHSTVGTTLANMATVLDRMGRTAEAERHFWSAVEVYEAALGQEHPRLASLHAGFASFLIGQSRFDEGLALATRAHGVALAGEFTPLVHRSRVIMIEAHLALGHHATVDSLLGDVEPALAAGEIAAWEASYRRLAASRQAQAGRPAQSPAPTPADSMP